MHRRPFEGRHLATKEFNLKTAKEFNEIQLGQKRDFLSS